MPPELVHTARAQFQICTRDEFKEKYVDRLYQLTESLADLGPIDFRPPSLTFGSCLCRSIFLTAGYR